MSDESQCCSREYANKVVLSEPELRYASKVLERKPIFALKIPHPLILALSKTLSAEKSSQEQLVDYTFLSASSNPGSCV